MDLFFFPGSTYTYLTAMRVEALAKTQGVTLTWRPFNVRAIMIEMDNIPFAKKPAKASYMWRDVERRAARHGIPIYPERPPYPVDPELKALKVAAVAAIEGWCAAFARQSYRSWFLEGKAPGVGTATEDAIVALGRDPHHVLRAAAEEGTGSFIEAETEAARRLGIFGSPTFAVGEEIFWGDDRLEDALDWAKDHPDD